MRAPLPTSPFDSSCKASSERRKTASFVVLGEELLPLSKTRTVPAPGGARTEFYGESGRLLTTVFQRNR